MTFAFILWAVAVLGIQPLAKRILSEHDKIRAEIRRKKMDDEPEYVSLLSDAYY